MYPDFLVSISKIIGVVFAVGSVYFVFGAFVNLGILHSQCFKEKVVSMIAAAGLAIWLLYFYLP